MIPVILSGGSGTRLWPLSRQKRPKQFLPVVENEQTLFQATLKRLQNIDNLVAPMVVCNEDHRFMVAEQLRQINYTHQGIVLEPVARNTAPAIALAALLLDTAGRDELMLVLPADHVIADHKAFHTVVNQAKAAALDGALVTFGVVPTKPETGYGYIRRGESLAFDNTYAVELFVEKPDQPTAIQYLESGDFLWNSGMFLFRSSSYLQALEKYAPDVLKACRKAVDGKTTDMDFTRVDSSAFSGCPGVSVDYAVMEKAQNVAIVPLDAGWSDVGSWPAVWEAGDKDKNGNVVHGDAMLHNASDNLVYSDRALVSLIGVHGLVVVDTQDATLVVSQEQAHAVTQIVEQLKDQSRPEAIIHREVNRPWGEYDCIDCGEQFQVKRITVKPGAKLSLQKHQYRSEHWIVVKGTAEVTCDDKVFLLEANQSTYIPLGSVHRLANPRSFPLELIEVQSGSYLGEDDIERFDDQYGREGKEFT